MITSFSTKLNLNTSQEALLSRDVFYYSQCYRKGLAAMCRALREGSTLKLYDYLSRFQLTSHQVNSIQFDIEAEIANAKANLIHTKKILETAIDKRSKAIEDKRKTINKKLKKSPNYLKSTEGRFAQQWVNGKKHTLMLKKAKLAEVIDRLDSNHYSITLGGKELLRKRTSSEGVKPEFDVNSWREEWRDLREGFRFSVGDKYKPKGNREIQVNLESNIVRFRLTDFTANERLALLPPKAAKLPAKFIELPIPDFKSLIKFCNKLGVTPSELLRDKPISARIYRRNKEYFLTISVDVEKHLPTTILNSTTNNILGLDFNADGIAWTVVKPDGNPLTGARGFESVSAPSEFTISNCITSLFKKAEHYGISTVSIENLDFFDKRAHMRSSNGTKKYNKMLSNLAYASYSSLVQRKCAVLGLKVALINPTYSSVAGFVRYAFKHNCSADIGAAIMIARQAVLGTAYRKKLDMSHVVRHKLHKEAVRVVLPNQLTNQRKRQDIGITAFSSWRNIASTLGYRRQWRVNMLKALEPLNLDIPTAMLSTGVSPSIVSDSLTMRLT